MKPAPFAYDRPQTEPEALALLAEHGEEAKLLAGGQSLIPLLNFRLAFPERLIDINRVSGLDYIEANGSLRIGALTRQSTLERSEPVAEGWPLIAEVMPLIAHFQIRNRGTVGGSIAHSDPAAELPTVFMALDARFHVHSARGERTLDSAELYVTHLTTRLEPDELLAEIEVPAIGPGTGQAFIEFARRHGDFALGGVAAVIGIDDDGRTERARIVLLGAGSTPIRATAAEAALGGERIDESLAAAAAAAAVAEIEPTGDIHGSSEYRRNLIEALIERAVLKANERAGRAGGGGDG